MVLNNIENYTLYRIYGLLVQVILLFILNWNETIHSHISSCLDGHIIFSCNCMCGVMVSMLASSVEDHGFDPQLGEEKKSMKLVFAASLLNKQHKGERAKTQNQEIVSIPSDISTSELELSN